MSLCKWFEPCGKWWLFAGRNAPLDHDLMDHAGTQPKLSFNLTSSILQHCLYLFWRQYGVFSLVMTGTFTYKTSFQNHKIRLKPQSSVTEFQVDFRIAFEKAHSAGELKLTFFCLSRGNCWWLAGSFISSTSLYPSLRFSILSPSIDPHSQPTPHATYLQCEPATHLHL